MGVCRETERMRRGRAGVRRSGPKIFWSIKDLSKGSAFSISYIQSGGRSRATGSQFGVDLPCFSARTQGTSRCNILDDEVKRKILSKKTGQRSSIPDATVGSAVRLALQATGARIAFSLALAPFFRSLEGKVQHSFHMVCSTLTQLY